MFKLGDNVIWRDSHNIADITKGNIIIKNNVFITVHWENGRKISYKLKYTPSEIEIDKQQKRNDILNNLGI